MPFLYKDQRQTGIFKWLRIKAGAYNYAYAYDQDGNSQTEALTSLGRGISCPLCVGGYVAFVLIILSFFNNFILDFFILWLAIWGVQIFLENLTSDDALKDAIDDVADSLVEK